MTILSVVVPSTVASSHRIACGLALCTYTYTIPSLRTSATAQVGPIGACFSNGYSYVAEIVFAAEASPVGTEPVLTPRATGAVVQSIFRRAPNVLPLPGSP